MCGAVRCSAVQCRLWLTVSVLCCASLCRSEVSAERLEQALHRKRDLKLHHSRSLEEVRRRSCW